MANEDKRIIELPASESILNDDWIGKDSASEGTTKIQLSFLKQLFGGNNFAGEWQSGTTYSKDSYVTREGKLYHNITGSATSTTWKASQWQEIDVSSELKKVVGSLAPTFDSSTNYDVDDLVTFNGGLCRCISPHSAGAWNSSHFADVNVSSLLTSFIMDNFTDRRWVKYSGSIVNYTKGTVIHKGLSMYRCKANTTNQSWDSSKWEQVDVTDLINSVTVLAETVLSNIAPTFSSLAQYSINEFVIYNNQLYICVKPHHGSWDSNDFSAGIIGYILEAIFNNIADVYSPSGSYVKDDVVNYLGMPLRCIVDTATSPMVFSEWEQVTVEQLINEKVADVQIAGQTTVDENHISDLTSLAIEGTASGEIASFSDGSNLPMRSFVCNIESVQDLHGYDAPWVGGSGKNKFDKNAVETRKALDRNTGETTDALGWCVSDYIKITENTAYTYFDNEVSVSNGIVFCYYDSNKGFISGIYESPKATKTITTPSSAIYVRFEIRSDALDVLQFELGSTATSYAPYSNICPISGHTGVDAWVRGKNLANPATVTTLYPTGDSGTYPNQIRSSSNARSVIAEVSPNTTYTISKKAGQRFRLAFTEEEPANGVADMGYEWNDTGTTITVTSPSNAKYMVVLFWSANVDTDTEEDMLATLQIEIGETASTYTPYNPNSQTISVSWQTEAGEVFGGYVDLVSGVLTVDRVSAEYVGNNDEGWTVSTGGSGDTSWHQFYIPRTSAKNSLNAICNRFPTKDIAYRGTESLLVAYTDRTFRIALKDNDLLITSVEDFKTWLSTNNLQIVYELATPQTYQLTPTQIKSLMDDITNAWCSTGNVNVKYNKDATIVINSLIARIEALENA